MHVIASCYLFWHCIFIVLLSFFAQVSQQGKPFSKSAYICFAVELFFLSLVFVFIKFFGVTKITWMSSCCLCVFMCPSFPGALTFKPQKCSDAVQTWVCVHACACACHSPCVTAVPFSTALPNVSTKDTLNRKYLPPSSFTWAMLRSELMVSRNTVATFPSHLFSISCTIPSCYCTAGLTEKKGSVGHWETRKREGGREGAR